MVEKVYINERAYPPEVMLRFDHGDKTEISIAKIEEHLSHAIVYILDVQSTAFDIARKKVVTGEDVKYMFARLSFAFERLEKVREMLKEIANKMGMQI